MKMKSFALLTTLLFVVLRIHSADNKRVSESCSFFSHILNQEVKYSVVLPEKYFTSNRSFPVVYLLHGLGDDETSWLEYGRIQQISDQLTKEGEILPMIFIMPQGFRGYYVNTYDGAFRYEDMFIQELIPHIDSKYRTISTRQQRAIMGYSMGGYGALILPLKNPDKFAACVPLSISIRTDEQYKIEDPSEWDHQWGRIFGGVGTMGESRLTDYYKQNNPFHIIQATKISHEFDFRIYINIGDDEQTLAFSNEELHILLSDKQIPHEFRVRNGGHEFSYWRDALPNGLRFISDAFAKKHYRGDLRNPNSEKKNNRVILKKTLMSDKTYEIYTPPCYDGTNRFYPVIYFAGLMTLSEKELLAGRIQYLINTGKIPPIIIVFTATTEENISNAISLLENKYRIRQGFRFRAIIGYEKGAAMALSKAMEPGQFTSCAILNGEASFDTVRNQLLEAGIKELEKTWFYIEAPDKSNNYRFNGKLHMLMREHKLYHEYRVSQGKGGINWVLEGLDSALFHIAKKFHR